MELLNKSAVIIGGAQGIGRALAIQLAKEGVDVFIGDINETQAKETAYLVEQLGRNSGYAYCDITDDSSVETFANKAYESLSSVNLLFNHAGVSAAGPYESLNSDDWNWVLNANITGIGRSLKAFLPLMNEGWVINTSSSAGLFHDIPVAGPYIASKAGIIGLSRALGTYLGNRGIGVSVLCPDITETNFMTSGRLVDIPLEAAMAMLPLDQLQSAEQVAKITVSGIKDEQFLISATPHYQSKLKAMIHDELMPGSDHVDANGNKPVIIQEVRFRVGETNRETILARFAEVAPLFKAHSGVRAYELRTDPIDTCQLCIFEAFDTQFAMDSHGAAPETLSFFSEVLALGAQDISARRI